MIESFSPLTRRILAIGLLVLVLLLAVRVTVAVAETVGDSVSELQDSRFRLARLQAIAARPAARPAPALQPELALPAAGADEAAGAMAAAVNAAAASAQIQLGAVAPLPAEEGNPQLVRLSLAASGPEPNLLAFVRDLEAASPAVRLHVWSIVPAAPAAPDLQLQAVAAGAWAPPR